MLMLSSSSSTSKKETPTSYKLTGTQNPTNRATIYTRSPSSTGDRLQGILQIRAYKHRLNIQHISDVLHLLTLSPWHLSCQYLRAVCSHHENTSCHVLAGWLSRCAAWLQLLQNDYKQLDKMKTFFSLFAMPCRVKNPIYI